MSKKKISEKKSAKKASKEVKVTALNRSKKELILLLKELVTKIAGANTEAIVDIIFSNRPVNEFKIAEKLELTINQTRNILYKLSAQSVVTSVRKKDAKKGWYIYSWSIDNPKALAKFIEYKTREITNNENLLNSRKTKGFYICPSECIETSEENAMLYSFKCPECGQLLQPEAFEEEIAELEQKIAVAKKEVEGLSGELTKITQAVTAKKDKKILKEKAEKLAVRRVKAALKKKENERLARKAGKTIKKKVKKKKKAKKAAKKKKKTSKKK